MYRVGLSGVHERGRESRILQLSAFLGGLPATTAQGDTNVAEDGSKISTWHPGSREMICRLAAESMTVCCRLPLFAAASSWG